MNKLVSKAKDYCVHISEVCNAPCSLLLTEPSVELKSCEGASFCKICKGCDVTNTMHYGCSEAYRWNGKYVCYCPKGLILILAALTSENNTLCHNNTDVKTECETHEAQCKETENCCE